MAATLFASDVHLSAARPQIVSLFVGLLEKAVNARHLYLLGDCFDQYLGDDDTAPPHAEVITALRKLSDHGVPISIAHGNHDFLIGSGFVEQTGATLLPDHSVIDVAGTQVLVMHGDTLCTDDSEYQAFRAYTRNPDVQKAFLAKTLEERRVEAQQIRVRSKQATRIKADDIMDVNELAVQAAMREHGVHCLLHGHTHRPAVHEFELDGQASRRIVLADWYESDSVLVWDDSGCRFSTAAQLQPSS